MNHLINFLILLSSYLPLAIYSAGEVRLAEATVNPINGEVPIAVQFGWSTEADGNLFNVEGLPASGKKKP